MDFDSELNNIYKKYNSFVDYINSCSTTLEELKQKMTKFFNEYYKSKDFDVDIVSKIEKHNIYFEDFSKDVDYLMKKIKKLNIKEVKLLQNEILKDNVIRLDDYILLPDGYEEDIYVDSDTNFSDFIIDKPNLKLVKDDDDISNND